jgi:hypothetical protein
MLEAQYQSGLKKKIRRLLPGCVVIKLEGQGLPDLLILYNTMWAVLEVKRSDKEPYQPNQEYYLDLLGKMSYSATIYPENEEEILNALQFAFKSGRLTRVPLA